MSGTLADPVYCRECKSLQGWNIRVESGFPPYVSLHCGHAIDLGEWTDQRQMMRGYSTRLNKAYHAPQVELTPDKLITWAESVV